MRKILTPTFFRRPALAVARDLLGKTLVRRVGKREVAATIVETEAYVGPEDKASHAHRGRTARNASMFERGGVWYVYFVYGMHWMLNAVTGRKDHPAAILIRGVEGAVGPGRVTKAFRIGKRFDGKPIGRVAGLWIEDRGVRIPESLVKRGPRVGVDYAGTWAKKPYRFRITLNRMNRI